MADLTAESLKPTQRFWRLLSPDRREIGYIYLYAVLIGVISLAGPLGVQAIINLIAGGDFNASLVVLAIVVAVAAAFVGVLKIMQTVIAETLQRRIFTRAALEFAYRLPRMKSEALKDSYPPELVNRFFDVVNIQKGLPKILLDFSGAIMQIIFGIVLIAFYNTFFGVFGLLFVLVLVTMVVILGSPSLNTSLTESKYKYRVAGWLEDVARANNTFKLAGGAELAVRRTDDLLLGYLGYREKHFRLLLWHYGLLIAVQALVTVGFLLLGGYLVIENEINIGQFVAAELVILAIVSNAEKVVYSFETVYDTLTGVEKLGSVTDIPLESSGSLDFGKIDTGKGLKVALTHLTFKYPRSGTVALNNLSFELAPNMRYCIAGYNRSGRTTLCALLAALRMDFEGRLLFNDTPIGNLDLDTLRWGIGDYTPQEEIINASIADNISLGHPIVQLADIQWAIELAGLKNWMAEQANGFETVLVAEGLDLPRSVRIRLLIARAVVRKPRLLVIGGHIEQLDATISEQVISNLVHPDRNWTLVIASNSRRVAESCDRVGVMHMGKLIVEGSPQEVLADGSVAGVWNA